MSDELKPDEWAALLGEINKLRQLITEFEGHLSVLEQRLLAASGMVTSCALDGASLEALRGCADQLKTEIVILQRELREFQKRILTDMPLLA